MRWLLCLILALAAPAYAQDVEQPRPLDSLTEKDIEREMQRQQWQGPSGFWTSPYKSEHGAYRYRLLLIGIGLVAATGGLTWHLVRKANAHRATRKL